MCLAIPGKIETIDKAVDETFRNARVSFDGIIKEVNVAVVPEAKVGDYVLVHAGLAISIVHEEEALKTLNYLNQMNELDELADSDTSST